MGQDLYREHEGSAPDAAYLMGRCVNEIAKLLSQVKGRELTHEEKLILAMIQATKDRMPFTWR